MEKSLTRAKEVPLCSTPQVPLTRKRDPCQPQSICHIPQSRAVKNPEQIPDTSKVYAEREKIPYTKQSKSSICRQDLGEVEQLTQTIVLQMKRSLCLDQSTPFISSCIQTQQLPARWSPTAEADLGFRLWKSLFAFRLWG